MTPYWLSFALPVIWAVLITLANRAGGFGQARLELGLRVAALAVFITSATLILVREPDPSSRLWWITVAVNVVALGWVSVILYRRWKALPKRHGWTEDAL